MVAEGDSSVRHKDLEHTGFVPGLLGSGADDAAALELLDPFLFLFFLPLLFLDGPSRM